MSNTQTFQNANGASTGPRPVVAREIREVEERVTEASRWIAGVHREMGRVVIGQRGLVDRLLLGLLTNGHILLEGVPGLAKTLSLKTLAGCIEGARFGRIQFTPDMLPSDITGTTTYHGPTATFQVRHGPVFANLVLADEINRAPAKVQSALLEAMQERQVTLGDETFKLPDPFLVLATQNPLEQEGTYPLPEAQIDRFMLKVVVRYPSLAEERVILDAMAVSAPDLRVSPVATLQQVAASRRIVDDLYVDDAIRDYIVRIVAATRASSRTDGPLRGLVSTGASPRATIALMLAARGWAFLQGRGYVVPEDVKALAPDVLRHRIIPSFDAEAQGIDGDEITRRVLERGGVAMSATATRPLAGRIEANVRRIEICSRRLSNDSFSGGVQSRFRGRGMDFDELREYVPGDDVRAIDWNASARTGRTFVKKYREERQLTVVFVVDMSASGALGAGEATKREQGVEIAGVLALAALRSEHRVGLELFTDSVERFVPPARGRAHTRRLVRELVAFEPLGRGTNLSVALKALRERLRRRAVVVILSDMLLGDGDAVAARAELTALGRKHDVVCIQTGDKHDRELPSVGLLTLEDVETGEIVELDTASARQRAALAKAVERTQERIRALTRSAQVDLLEVDTLKPYLGPLIGFFKARGVRS